MKMSVEVFLVLFWVRGSATFCCGGDFFGAGIG